MKNAVTVFHYSLTLALLVSVLILGDKVSDLTATAAEHHKAIRTQTQDIKSGKFAIGAVAMKMHEWMELNPSHESETASLHDQ